MRLQLACFSGMATFVGIAMSAAAWAAGPHETPIREFADTTVKRWVSSSVVLDAIREQNIRHAGLSQADIDALDQQWRAETQASEHPLIDQTLANRLSQFLAGVRESHFGIVTEVFVMDNRGLNVGQSNVTSDYWQGDEAKWQETYLVGPNAILIDGVELDESTQTFQSQLSMSIVDPETGEPIGSITVGIDVELII